ncbi:MAG TPA: polyketide synthase, partial [Thermoanaerobaculia bacterium]
MSGGYDDGQSTGLEIAIIGMAGRFPGARNIEEYWRNLAAGVESITYFTPEQLARGGDPPAMVAHPDYVPVGRNVDDCDLFDAAFFGITPREAEIIDPQQRLFLECVYEALEDAGYDTDRYPGAVGIYAGCRMPGYLLNVYRNPAAIATVGEFHAQVSNDKDYLATRISYKLNLGGPSVSVQTACSTALVALHFAGQGLLSGETDMAVAGGVAIKVPLFQGYLSHDGDVGSSDGHVRPFDAKAKGTIFGSAMGAVVLKRLEDAIADGDLVHAVIKGTAINNDAAAKVGYTAPGADGQARVIRAAQIAAGVEPDTISYVEAHGTGTPMGDPIEVGALTRAFGERTERRQFCGIGSVKSNIGHAGAAAGVTGLIKTVLALRHELIPPSLLYDEPNPQIDVANSPFYVVTEPTPWRSEPDGPP